VTDSRSRRQRAIAEIIRSGGAGSQEEVTARLAELGMHVTQATVSRDLDSMGAVKVKRGGNVSYALPDQIGSTDWAAARLTKIVAEWVQSAEAAGNMVVLKTPPGSAHLVGLALDQAQLPEIAGTVSGDDTLFLVVRNGFDAGIVAGNFKRMSAGVNS
jgi:transcriptional regulator of arginine metabolism